MILNYEAILYEAILADIDARIAKLQATRENVVDLMALTGAEALEHEVRVGHTPLTRAARAEYERAKKGRGEKD